MDHKKEKQIRETNFDLLELSIMELKRLSHEDNWYKFTYTNFIALTM